MTAWIAVLGGSVVCYAIKLAGLSMPERILGHPRVQRVAGLLPIALLAALAAIQTFGTGRGLALDPRAAGLAAATVALVLRAPFLVVVVAAAVVTALLRLVV
ncbi:MAG: AzlD domain-containing protein [Actinomycetales bacterium]